MYENREQRLSRPSTDQTILDRENASDAVERNGIFLRRESLPDLSKLVHAFQSSSERLLIK